VGIGLTVCRRLVEAQGGRIWAARRPSGGSEFGFSLRLALDDEEAPAPANQDAAGAPSG
jgi:two-component system sensor kinase FixL